MRPLVRWLAAVSLVLLLAGCAAPVAAGPNEPHAIVVTGTGRVAVAPDTALVQVGAEVRAPALAGATADVARRMGAVLGQVEALGVEDRDVTTIAYSVDPVVTPRRGEDESPRIVAYRAMNVVQLRIRRLPQVGAVVDAAVAAGANILRGLTFTIDDPAAATAEARARAVHAAAAKARQLADAAGVILGELLWLGEGSGGPGPISPRMARAGALVASAPGPVEAGQLEIVVSVEARYRIGP